MAACGQTDGRLRGQVTEEEGICEESMINQSQRHDSREPYRQNVYGRYDVCPTISEDDEYRGGTSSSGSDIHDPSFRGSSPNTATVKEEQHLLRAQRKYEGTSGDDLGEVRDLSSRRNTSSEDDGTIFSDAEDARSVNGAPLFLSQHNASPEEDGIHRIVSEFPQSRHGWLLGGEKEEDAAPGRSSSVRADGSGDDSSDQSMEQQNHPAPSVEDDSLNRERLLDSDGTSSETERSVDAVNGETRFLAPTKRGAPSDSRDGESDGESSADGVEGSGRRPTVASSCLALTAEERRLSGLVDCDVFLLPEALLHPAVLADDCGWLQRLLQSPEMRPRCVAARLRARGVVASVVCTPAGLLADRVLAVDVRACRVLLSMGAEASEIAAQDGAIVFDLLLDALLAGSSWGALAQERREAGWFLLLLLIGALRPSSARRDACLQRLLFAVCARPAAEELLRPLLSLTRQPRRRRQEEERPWKSRSPLFDVDSRDALTGDSPLHVALANDCLLAAQALAAAGADVNATNRAGDTPLHVVARRPGAVVAAFCVLCEEEAAGKGQEATQEEETALRSAWRKEQRHQTPDTAVMRFSSPHAPPLLSLTSRQPRPLSRVNPCLVNHHGQLPEMLASDEVAHAHLAKLAQAFRAADAAARRIAASAPSATAPQLAPRLPLLPMEADYSRCREAGGPVPVWNFVDGQRPLHPGTVYATDVIRLCGARDDRPIPFLPVVSGCHCVRRDHALAALSPRCRDCTCTEKNSQLRYTLFRHRPVLRQAQPLRRAQSRKLRDFFAQQDAACMEVFECHDSCRCPADCCNRVLADQRGMRHPLEVFRFCRHGRAEWGVRTRRKILAGELIVPFLGEMRRSGRRVVMDTKNFANVAALIRVNDAQFNCVVVFVHASHHRGVPTPCVFAAKRIHNGQELVLRRTRDFVGEEGDGDGENHDD